MSVKCPKCQTENPSDYEVCKECGAKLALLEEMPLHTKTLQTPSKKTIKDNDVEDIIDEKYTLLEELGSGGMGVVYKAKQKEPIKRNVALKIIKLGMDTKEVVARFEMEKQALAVMTHPNIAKVHDAGATKRGRPYFVMELVSGIPITDYCDKHNLTTKERLELFIPVCEAVQHAHLKGVIHRDLKPSNVLVEISEDKPVPKIIDFGIAKATEHRLAEKTLFTERGQLIGTPEYMSPEQAEMSDLDVDTRTDIYSLGVMLYELLVGVLPFDPRALRSAGFGEIQRIIRDEEPPRASTRLSGLGDTQTSIAKKRKTDVASLHKQLKGDLDWITMKAMEKDRTRRYSTASDLIADITRHLKKEPIIARPPSRIYNVGKFIRRHKWGVAMVTLLILAVVIGGAAATLGFVRATKAERLAKQEAQTATQVSNFLVDLFNVSDPGEARGNTITAREILGKGAQEIGQGLQEQPLVRARLMDTIGTVYRNLGLYNESEPLIRKALEIRENQLGPENLQVAQSLMGLALLFEKQGKYPGAVAYSQRSIEIQEKRLKSDHPDIAKSLHLLGRIYFRQIKFDETLKLYTRALEIREKALGPNHPDVAESLHDLGALHYLQSQFDEAEQYFKRALAIRESSLGPDHPDVGYTINSLAGLYLWLRRYDEAEPLYERALAIRQKTLGPDHPEVANTYNSIAILHHYQRNYAEAEKYYRISLEINKKSLREDHPAIAGNLENLAILCHVMGRIDEAEGLYSQALPIMEKAFGADNPELVSVLDSLALIYLERGNYREAEEYTRRALNIMEKSFGPSHPRTARSLINLGYFNFQTGKYDEAEKQFKSANAILEKEFGPEDFEIAEILKYLGELYFETKRYEEAEQQLLRGLAIFEKVEKPDLELKAGILSNLGYLYFRGLKRYEDAESYFKRAMKIIEEDLDIYYSGREITVKEYADLLRIMGRKEEATKLESRINLSSKK